MAEDESSSSSFGSDDDTEDKKPVPPKERQLHAGDSVTAAQDVTSNSKPAVVIPRGTVGFVKRIDEAGDAMIQFEGIDKGQWIKKKNFGLLVSQDECVSSKIRRRSQEETDERARELNLDAPRPCGDALNRRGGVVTSTQNIFEGLKEKFNAMEKLDDSETDTKDICTADVEFIRILLPHQFRIFLQKHGVPVDDYDKKDLQSKSVRDLWAEVVFRECSLVPVRNEAVRGGFSLQRAVRVVYLEVEALIGSETRYLLLENEVTKTQNKRSNLNTRPSKKLFDDEDEEEATWRCMIQNFNLSEKMCFQLFQITSIETRSELKASAGFPGLPTAYSMVVVSIRTLDPSRLELAQLGLPSGSEFSTQSGRVLGSSTRFWKWCSHDELVVAKAATAGTLTEDVKRRFTVNSSSIGEFQ